MISISAEDSLHFWNGTIEDHEEHRRKIKSMEGYQQREDYSMCDKIELSCNKKDKSGREAEIGRKPIEKSLSYAHNLGQ